ncbi:MAG: hypothetical protein SF162_12090 [bacterium]|nr:hypothetical protein [bacterium]
MPSFLESTNSLLFRTDFTHDKAWAALIDELDSTGLDLRGLLEYVSDAAYDGWTTDQIAALFRDNDEQSFVLVADSRTFSDAIWDVVANLPIANMGFEDFRDQYDADGLHRP